MKLEFKNTEEELAYYEEVLETLLSIQLHY